MTVFPVYINDFTMHLKQNELGDMIVQVVFPGRDPFRAPKDRCRFIGVFGSENDGFRGNDFQPDHNLLISASCIFLFQDHHTKDLDATIVIQPDTQDPQYETDYHWGIFRPAGALRVTYRTHLFGRDYTQMFSFAPIDYAVVTAADATAQVRERAEEIAAWMTAIRADIREQRIDGFRSRTIGPLIAQIRWWRRVRFHGSTPGK